MPKNEEIEINSKMLKKLEYIGLDIDDVPDCLKEYNNINFKTIRGYDEKKYTQYRYINVKDIEIMLSPTTRVNTIKEKYEKAEPLYMYLDTTNEENIIKNAEFLSMLNKVNIRKIQDIEKEQKKLQKELPYKIKFSGNYLWQIYYSEVSDRYFMIVPTKDSDYSTFFYLIKKKIEEDEDAKIFVPISCVGYDGNVLNKDEIKDLENYLWLFTKDYPSIYEIWDEDDEMTLNIVGETEIYDKTKTLYKIVLEDSKKASRFYKLIKALFILQTELPHYYQFETNIDENGKLKLYYEGKNIDYDDLPDFIMQQYIKSVELENKTEDNIQKLKEKLNKLQVESKDLEEEYILKEKQITTYLECKKSFFGKVKYFFKIGKFTRKNEEEYDFEDEEDDEEDDDEKNVKKKKQNIIKVRKQKGNSKKSKYTLYELEQSYKSLEVQEQEANNLVMDINALKLKNKNLKKKIENASKYIDEINNHKKSIFEFWKYSNKDAVAELEEGEEEELNVTKLEKVFEYDDEFEDFGNDADKNQRNTLTDQELESVFIANTNVLQLLNKIYTKTAENREISLLLRDIKEYIVNGDDDDEESEDFDIFGRLKQASNKERTIANKVHREQPREEVAILEVKKDTKGIDFKKRLIEILKNIKRALKKNQSKEIMYVYKASNKKLEFNTIEKVSLTCDKELDEFLKNNKDCDEIYLYKMKLPKETNFVAFTNIIFFDNKNMTLPVGMNLSNEILIDLSSMSIEDVQTKKINKLEFEDEKDDFSDIIVKTIDVNEVVLRKKEKKNAR